MCIRDSLVYPHRVRVLQRHVAAADSVLPRVAYGEAVALELRAVSYTHLDVYKRQEEEAYRRRCLLYAIRIVNNTSKKSIHSSFGFYSFRSPIFNYVGR